ncbi:capsular biosynthesis protein [Roseomonas sp. SSH11]|uniref:Capsular biosynthesis protein n=1 Tax=Pararoseomonas baculiformis TaxID=2820812 RepID=A0ABS4AB73_9PROT|nr:capsular biosynthesis protein [Pararoseomonas baculiformis]MBP0444260.1 capsular biosynthesis protein [Pararoseomonas baculiformis]
MSSTSGIWLIMSGAYVGAELAAEFGNLPPAFLPVGMARLYEYHLTRLGSRRPVYFTLPESYEITTEDRRRLDELGVTVIPVPDNLQLGEAVTYAVNTIGAPDQPLRILHGDTLIDDLALDTVDSIALAENGDGYSWAEADLAGGHVRALETLPAGSERASGRPVAAGYFAFASSINLVRSITRARGDFVAGINLYAKERPLQAQHVENWFDFGHAQTYFRSRRAVTTARSFNTLRLDGRTARKMSADGDKMRAEAHWLQQVPPSIQLFTARVLDSGESEGLAFYETEYQYIPTLSELFVFGSLSRPVWTRAIESCGEFLSLCARNEGPDSGKALLRKLAIDKTVSRLEDFARSSGFEIDRPLSFAGRPFPSLMGIAKELTGILERSSDRASAVMHGDFCFSNILYDSRTCRIKVIDPRGYIDTGVASIHGDRRYDLAKLAHSIIGRYDHIIAGRYTMSANEGYRLSINFERTPQQAWLQRLFNEILLNDSDALRREVHAVMTGLFLSMIPLHSDRPDRQRAFIANALRLYGMLEEVPA